MWKDRHVSALRLTVFALSLALGTIGSARHAMAGPGPAWLLKREAASFDRYHVTDPQYVEAIRSPGNRHGLAGTEGMQVKGWFEYDFTVPKTGWYKLSVTGENNGGGIEYVIDPSSPRGSISRASIYAPMTSLPKEKVGNVWLTLGKHTLRVERYYWTGFSPIRSFSLTKSSNQESESVRAEIVGAGSVFKVNQCRALRIYSGDLSLPGKLTVWVKDAVSGDVRSTLLVTLPRSEGVSHQDIPIYCKLEGEYTISFGDWNANPISDNDMGYIHYSVIGSNPVTDADSEVKRTLVQEINCAAELPDYAAGRTHVVRKPFGSYRESGSNGWLAYQSLGVRQRASAPEPSWFAYKLAVKDVQQLYMVEVDYPDDATRTYAIALRESDPLTYPVAAGVDSGGEFSITNKMHTLTLLFWPRATQTRIVFAPAKMDRAAAARIRVYKVDGGLPALVAPKTGFRHFVNWYEEGTNYLSIFGAPDESDHGFRIATERWAKAVAYMGGDTLSAAVNVYNFVLYPSSYNKAFAIPAGSDRLGQMLFISEKYGLKFLPELHPRADELAWPYADSPDPKPNLLVSKDGTTNYYAADGKTRNLPPYYNPLYPANQEWYIGMIGELVDKYKGSPALLGVSLRLMQWQNPTLNNFNSLDWGYDDYTVELFQKDTGITVPAKKDDPRRFRQRYEWLMAHARDAWIAWRCQKIAQLYTRIRDRVRQARADLKVYSSVFDGYPSEFGTDWLRGAGVDVQLLSRIDGVVLINALHAYGRVYADNTTQGTRDNLLDPRVLKSMIEPNGSGKFLAYTRYAEANTIPFPPQQLGFDSKTKQTWMSAVINPAGRHSLERYAIELAETDASLLGDGGNGYTLGQPVLREFMQEYRRLPTARFTPRKDARDPVAVWALSRSTDYLFYAVNRERFSVILQLRFDGLGEVRRLSSGQKMLTQNSMLNIQLQPYQLMAFTASAGVNITAATSIIPVEDLNKVTSQVLWLENLSREMKNIQLTSRLTPNQRQTVQVAAQQAREALNQNRVWRARTIMENHELLPVYERIGRYPPYLRDSVPGDKRNE